jgi:hypothetical protein
MIIAEAAGLCSIAESQCHEIFSPMVLTSTSTIESSYPKMTAFSFFVQDLSEPSSFPATLWPISKFPPVICCQWH